MGTRLKAGFTLIEALVALALVLAFASVLGPYLFQARRIVANVDGRVAAQVLLRTLLDAPFDRTRLANAVREGEVSGLRWRIVTAPIEGATTTSTDGPKWAEYRVTATVSSGGGRVVVAETVRLAKVE